MLTSFSGCLWNFGPILLLATRAAHVFQVLQLKDDIDTSLVQAGAATVASSDHEVRLTEVVRVAVRKQQEIQELQANVSGFLLCSAKVFFGMFGGTSFWDLCKDKCWNFKGVRN